MIEKQWTLLDVSRLPRHAFGPRQITWWGNIAFMLIEGTTLVICAVTYLYLRRNFDAWPPNRTPPPGLLIPFISLLFLSASTAMAHVEGRCAKRGDLDAMRFWGLVGIGVSLIALVLRFLEFSVLNTRWDHDAYGSILWFTIGIHTTLLLLQFLEDIFFILLAYLEPIQPDHFSHVVEKAEYAYFVWAIWIPLFILLFLGPRFL